MREGLVLSLVSSLQMAQQSALNALVDGLAPTSLAASAAAFPLGKLSTTLFLVVNPCDARRALTIDAIALIFGGIIALVPSHFSWVFLALGRFFMGAGSGIGFVSASVVLAEIVPYAQRPSHFLVLGLSFAFSTFIANLLPLFEMESYSVVLCTCLFSIGTGSLYLCLRPRPSSLVSDSKYHSEPPVLSTFNNRKSKSPVMLTNVLMMLNVTIGVPIILAFSKLIFEEFGLEKSKCCYLSIIFPMFQMLIIFILYKNKQLNRRLLVVGGYALSVFVMFFLLLTSSYPFIPNNQKALFQGTWFFLLAIVTCVPCNTAICVIAEQFGTPSEQLRYGSAGRAIMWFLTAISTSTFIPCMNAYGFTMAFAPYTLFSVLLLFILIKIYPKEEDCPLLRAEL